MSTPLRARAEHAAKYGANLVVPARQIKDLLDRLDTVRTALAPYLAGDHDSRCDGDSLDDCNRCAATEIAAALAAGGEVR